MSNIQKHHNNQLVEQIGQAGIDLNLIQSKIVKATSRQKIREMDEETYIAKMRTIAKYASIDLGIRKLDDYELVRFTDIVGQYFSDLSILDIKLAFEMLIIGELDSYLPRGKYGPETEHYQSFNAKFVTKVLKAYRNLRGKTVISIKGQLPQQTKTWTDEEKKEARRGYVESVKSLILDWYKNGKIGWQFNSFMLEYFIKVGLCEEIGKPTKKQIEQGKNLYLTKEKSNYKARYAQERLKAGEIIPEITFRSEQVAIQEAILNVLKSDQEKEGENIIKKIDFYERETDGNRD